MTTTGIVLWSLVIGLLIFGLLRKNRSNETNENHQDQRNSHQHHKGGCCG